MNIDERLEAITTQLELLTHMQRDNETRFEQVEKNLDRVTGILAQVSGDIGALARIAESHDRRISDLENGSVS